MDCLLGIELGTTNIKVGVFDAKGRLIKKVSRLASIEIGETDGKATADPNLWWETLKLTLNEINCVFPKYELKGIAVGSHGPSVVTLDSHFNPVLPSILWMDKRAHKQADFMAEKLGKKSNDLTWYVPRVLWLKEHFPEEFKKVRHVCQALDFINCKLTGKLTASLCSDDIKPWTTEMIDAADLDHKLFPEYKKLGEFLGSISDKISQETGLPAGTPVFSATGGADFVEVLIGTGTLENGIICDRAGTSQGVEFCWSHPGDKFMFFSVPHPIVKGSYHIAGLMSTTGKSLQWFRDTFYKPNLPYDQLIKNAAKSPPGAKKLLFLPTLMGIRTPWWDVDARGVFMGISLWHKKEDFLRAVLEGTAFGMAQIINIFKKNGGIPTEIRVSGMQSKSDLWNQIKADITGLPVKTTTPEDSSILGLAIVAGKSAGIFNCVKESADKLVKIKKVYYPNPDNAQIYSNMLKVYENLYPSLKENFYLLKNS